METEFVELHDSTLGAVQRDGDDVVVVLDRAYIHRSNGTPGVDAGTGWAAIVAIRIRNAVAISPVTPLPVDIADGTLFVSAAVLENGFPLPYAAEGPARLQLVLSSGERVEIRGTAVSAASRGIYEYVEDFR